MWRNGALPFHAVENMRKVLLLCLEYPQSQKGDGSVAAVGRLSRIFGLRYDEREYSWARPEGLRGERFPRRNVL
jgi:hypothetical protein